MNKARTFVWFVNVILNNEATHHTRLPILRKISWRVYKLKSEDRMKLKFRQSCFMLLDDLREIAVKSLAALVNFQ